MLLWQQKVTTKPCRCRFCFYIPESFHILCCTCVAHVQADSGQPWGNIRLSTEALMNALLGLQADTCTSRAKACRTSCPSAGEYSPAGCQSAAGCSQSICAACLHSLDLSVFNGLAIQRKPAAVQVVVCKGTCDQQDHSRLLLLPRA